MSMEFKMWFSFSVVKFQRGHEPRYLTKIAVDEVYAKKTLEKNETRDDKFFTIITDIDKKKVVWVSDG